MALHINLERIRPGYLLKPRGKNLRFTYLTRCFLHGLVPKSVLRARMERLLGSLESRPDRDAILDRVDYCCKLTDVRPLTGRKRLRDIPNGQGNYNRDFFEYARYFRGDLFVDTAFGDNTSIPKTPSITKSRPVRDGNENDVLMKLNKVRHFMFLKDRLAFEEKKDGAIFRGACYQADRRRFMEKYFGSPLIDCGDTGRGGSEPAEWKKPLITPYDHLKYKFVVSIEGNDVASNLKWIMSSNSIALMPRPRYETWFMEGRLVPGVHFAEIRPDFADVEEKIRWYAAHPEEAHRIIAAAHAWVDQFRDPEREDIISLLVLRKYFEKTGQKI
ncbi:MAG: CAP10 domain-containing protein [Burkholderia sp.]